MNKGKELPEKLRQARLREVRRQEKRFASKVRDEFQERLERERNLVASHLKALWLEDRESERQELEAKHRKMLKKVGQSHQLATHAHLRDVERCQRQRAVEAREKAIQRHRRALSEVMQQRKEENEKEKHRTQLRHAVIGIEKERAATVAAKPLPPSQEIILNLAIDKGHRVRLTNVEGYTSTHCHLPAGAVCKEIPQTQIDARKAAQKLEEHMERKREVAAREQLERNEKAWLRHKQAWKEVKVKQDYAALITELDDLEKADRLQRKKAIERPLKRLPQQKTLSKPKEDPKEKELEAVIERMLFDSGSDDALTAESSRNESSATDSEAAERRSVHIPREMPASSSSSSSLGVDSSRRGDGETALEEPDPLQSLLERVRAQRAAIAEDVAVEPPSVVAAPEEAATESVDEGDEEKEESLDGERNLDEKEESSPPVSQPPSPPPDVQMRMQSQSPSIEPVLETAATDRASVSSSRSQHELLIRLQERLASQRRRYDAQKESMSRDYTRFSFLNSHPTAAASKEEPPPIQPSVEEESTRSSEIQSPASFHSATGEDFRRSPILRLSEKETSDFSPERTGLADDDSGDTSSSLSSSLSDLSSSIPDDDDDDEKSVTDPLESRVAVAYTHSIAESSLTVECHPPRDPQETDFPGNEPSLQPRLPPSFLIPTLASQSRVDDEDIDLSIATTSVEDSASIDAATKDPSHLYEITATDDVDFRFSRSPEGSSMASSSLIDLSVALRDDDDEENISNFDVEDGASFSESLLSNPSQISVPWHVVLKSAEKANSSNRKETTPVLSFEEPIPSVGIEEGNELSLQEAFARKKQRFVEASQARKAQVAERAQERREKLEEEKRKIEAEKRRKEDAIPSLSSSPIVKVSTDSPHRKITKREMMERNRRFYDRLPEVKQKRSEDRRKASYAENRKKAKEFNKKLQDQAKQKHRIVCAN
ncbi:centrosomal protein of 295 kDa-like isoform X2 [Oscarella lobularis]|uniref:centrosomal protein of 295 kDa-like isoform X2 n=1 Tax=Oscarella lobularis TaxID=121494 RepID=UPI003313BC61